MNKDIENCNDNGQYHGYQQWYDTHGLWYRGNHKNDTPIGYVESNWTTKIGLTGTEVEFYIK
jgi:hypothetical protein